MQLLEKANGNIVRSNEEKERMIKNAAHHYGEFLTALGFDWQADENSKKTPERVAKAWVNDLISGTNSREPEITSFPSNNYDGMVFQGNIPVISMCSHHNLAFIGQAHVAYIPGPKGQVIGLSKLNRIVDWYSRRPQIQEGLTMQIIEHVNRVCKGNQGVAVTISAEHNCVKCRGIKNSSQMTTAKLTGFFKGDIAARNEFYSFVSRTS